MVGAEIQSGNLKNVLVVTTSAYDVDELVQLRDYVVESINLGVLALADKMTLRVEQLPACGVQVEHILEDTSTEMAMASPPRTEELANTIKKSAEAQEKESIQNRLKAYREAHGLGCFEALAKKYGGGGRYFTASTLRDIINSEASIPIEKWRKVGQALEKEERSGGAR